MVSKTIILVVVMVSFFACRRTTPLSLVRDNENKTIAIQPFDSFDEKQLSFLKHEVRNFFHANVIVLPSLMMPPTYRHWNEDKYSADSLLQILSGLANDSILLVVGITHKNIYTSAQKVIKVTDTQFVWKGLKGVFGLSLVDGNSCIVSAHRLMNPDQIVLDKRLRNAIIHELGHNLGLAHCSADSCLMSEKNGDAVVLTTNSGDYCDNCRKKVD